MNLNETGCPMCGRTLHSQRFAELHRRTFHPTPDEQMVDRSVAQFVHGLWELFESENARRAADKAARP